GKGSRFFFTIKLSRAKRSEVNRNRMMPDRPLDVFNKHALLAEDTADSRKLISLMIAKLGITSDLAENGKMALEMYRNGDYDLVLMDGNMPEMDGAEATRAIRHFERESGRAATPIIALSAKVFADDRDAFIEAGADDFVVKPVSIRALSTAIRKLFRNEEIEVVENEEEPSEDDGYIRFLSRKMGLPYKITEDLLREFVASFPTYIDDILSSVESGDVKRIEHAAHRLKGVAASYELEPLSAKCALLEEYARTGVMDRIGTLPSEIYAEAEKVRVRLESLLVAE
ncbi:MAG TPA: response regulator, partial [Spirochaetota bacterium]|nr:response regulator [Spirochaetota bacterium]